MNGKCVCNADSCPHGCCDVNQICHASDNKTCGVHGVACVACPHGSYCHLGTCVAKPCKPEPIKKTCKGIACGTAVNNCGQSVTCGTCAAGQTCTNGQCVTPSAVAPSAPVTQLPGTGAGTTAKKSDSWLTGAAIAGLGAAVVGKWLKQKAQEEEPEQE